MNAETGIVIKTEPIDETVVKLEEKIGETEEKITQISSSCFECIECKIYFQTYDEFKDHTKNQHNKIYLEIIKNHSEDIMEVPVEKQVSSSGLKLQVVDVKKEVEKDLLIPNETSREMGNSENNKNISESNIEISGENNIKQEDDEDMLIPNGTPRELDEDSVLCFKCIECKKKFKTYDEFKDHKRLTHNEHHYVDTIKNQTNEQNDAVFTVSFVTNTQDSSNLLIPNGVARETDNSNTKTNNSQYSFEISGEKNLLQHIPVSNEPCTLNNIKQEDDESMLIPNGAPREKEKDSVHWFKCVECKKRFKSYDEFKDHKRLAHNEHHYVEKIKNQTDELIAILPTGSLVTNSMPSDFEQTLRTQPATTSSKSLNSDVNLTPQALPVNFITIPPILFQCIYCKLNFLSAIELTKHQEVEHKAQFLVKDSSEQVNVNPNIQAENRGTKRALDVDDQPTKSANHFIPEVHGKCEECGDLFASKKELNKHCNLEHVKRWKYECHICKMKFNYSRHLKRHLPKHLEETFKCGICNKQYTSKASLTRHHHTHHKGVQKT